MRFAPALSWITLAVASCGDTGAEPSARSAVLITLDTTRYDAIGRSIAGRPLTPILDRLASEGVRYEWCRATAPMTLPSHASMLTGLYPLRHGVRDNAPLALPDSATTLAERARAAGLETAAFVASVVLDERMGLAQGFDVYDQLDLAGGDAPHSDRERDGALVAQAATDWLQRRDPSRPFFLWAHFYDPHVPYDPPVSFLRRAGGNAYLGEVGAMDAAIGSIVRRLEELGLLDETLIVAVADHGEGLGDHGEPTHGTLCYDATLRVPLIVRYPDGRRAGESSDAIVSVVDVFPTILDALGMDLSETDGLSLMDEIPAQRGVYFEAYAGYLNCGWSPVTGWADGRGKYIHSSEPELFNAARDPGETTNTLADCAELISEHRAEIRAVSARSRLEPDTGPIDPELVAGLQALGYAAVAGPGASMPEPLEPSDLASPRDRLDELIAVLEARDLGLAGERGAAIAMLREVVRENPRNLSALDHLAFDLGEEGLFDEQIEVLRTRLHHAPDSARSHVAMGRAMRVLGRMSEALEHYGVALSLDPASEAALRGRIAALTSLGRLDEAKEAARALNTPRDR